MFVLSRKRRSTVSQDELVILIVVLIAWGFGTASIVLNWKPQSSAPISGGDGVLDTSGRSLMVVLDEELLVELALWWWVAFVFWATRPSYG
jgi:hypothetical protein